MEILLVLLTFLIHNRIKFKRQEIFQIKILFIKEHFCVKITKYMPMVMKMTMHTYTIQFKKHGKKND
jgi:hypothetical protein